MSDVQQYFLIEYLAHKFSRKSLLDQKKTISVQDSNLSIFQLVY